MDERDKSLTLQSIVGQKEVTGRPTSENEYQDASSPGLNPNKESDTLTVINEEKLVMENNYLYNHSQSQPSGSGEDNANEVMSSEHSTSIKSHSLDDHNTNISDLTQSSLLGLSQSHSQVVETQTNGIALSRSHQETHKNNSNNTKIPSKSSTRYFNSITHALLQFTQDPQDNINIGSSDGDSSMNVEDNEDEKVEKEVVEKLSFIRQQDTCSQLLSENTVNAIISGGASSNLQTSSMTESELSSPSVQSLIHTEKKEIQPIEMENIAPIAITPHEVPMVSSIFMFFVLFYPAFGFAVQFYCCSFVLILFCSSIFLLFVCSAFVLMCCSNLLVLFICFVLIF